MIDYNNKTLQNATDSDLPFSQFVRTPFSVEALIITEENIESVARLVGTVRVKNDEKYIALDRRVVPNISRAYIGWYLTRLGDNLRCYSPKVFMEQFEPMPDTMIVHFDFNNATDEDPGFVEATEDTLNQITFE
jgi:hypothetical protein